MSRITVNGLIEKKRSKQKISVVTSYDYSSSALCDKAAVDILLVGDSAGMVMLGQESTTNVTMEQMCMFTSAVAQARKNSMIVADLPFLSYQPSIQRAIENAGMLIQAGADAVKLEGGKEVKDTVEAVSEAGIPVMGHIGLKPQTTTLREGYKVQGKTKESAENLLKDATALEEAGAFSIVLEMIVSEASKIITNRLSVPTIGIGSGPHCDGQVLVYHDMLGLYDKIKPKFVKQYHLLSDEITKAIAQYKTEVENGKFPSKDHSFSMEESELSKLKEVTEKY